ncbi:MAG: hypothetical protein HS114_12530 [Anaerolineales bacterium]|nr:hypothetical protein [Anaerolineales bacterium]
MMILIRHSPIRHSFPSAVLEKTYTLSEITFFTPRRKVAKVFSLKNLAFFAPWREVFLFPINSTHLLRLRSAKTALRAFDKIEVF